MLFKLLVATLACASASKLGASKVQPRSKPQAQPLDKALALRGGVSLEQASLLGALYYGFFGVGLLASPSFFFGPDGLIPYFKEEAGPGGSRPRHSPATSRRPARLPLSACNWRGSVFFARSFGAFMAACAYSHFTDGPSAAVVKYMAVAGALMMPQWALCTMDDEGHNTLLWKIHTPVQLGMIALLGKAGGLF